MTKDEIIELARGAGLVWDQWGACFKVPASVSAAQALERFAALVAAKEREECATLVQLGPPPVTGFGSRVEIGFGARTAYAAAIRARGQKEGA